MKKTNDITFKQCKLQRLNATTTSWIPSKFAKLGQYLKLKDRADKTDNWIDGWKVESVGHLEVDRKTVISRSEDYKNQRKVSDI
tara:strand:+ start:3552 stop:3803 length:252 start_codon:yes stop_codon:yes gene_type:complete